MKTSTMRFRATEEQRNQIEMLASQSSAGSVSGYIRSCALNKKLKSTFDHDIALELLKLNSDLARLGNLFRLSLKDSNKYSAEQIDIIQNLLIDTCKKIKDKVIAL
jgi:hypothetical protein